MYQYQNVLSFIFCDSRSIYGWYWLQDNRCNAKTVLYWMMTKCEENFGSLLFLNIGKCAKNMQHLPENKVVKIGKQQGRQRGS